MRIKVMYDKGGLTKNLHVGWGLSFLIDDKILFDTGEKSGWLLENMRALKIDVNRIEAVVISHDHWDHWGGLWGLLRKRKGLRVYMCPHFSRAFRHKARALGAELIAVKKAAQLGRNFFSTGEVPGAYKGRYMPEQALVLKTKKGLTVITGCAHPGILKMVKRAQAMFPHEPIYLVLGGFHLMDAEEGTINLVVKQFKKMNVLKAGPTHCSGDAAEAIFKESYGNDYISIKAGKEIEVC